jgi:MFS transporter, YNFM family, putative membrane transport protein
VGLVAGCLLRACLLLLGNLWLIIAGLALIGVGTFFAQATATSFVGHVAMGDRGAASGIYLASYFFGGLVGSVLLGQVFDRFGWSACVLGIAMSLGAVAILTLLLKPSR